MIRQNAWMVFLLVGCGASANDGPGEVGNGGQSAAGNAGTSAPTGTGTILFTLTKPGS